MRRMRVWFHPADHFYYPSPIGNFWDRLVQTRLGVSGNLEKIPGKSS